MDEFEDRQSRRRLLRAGLASVGFALAGCLRFQDDPGASTTTGSDATTAPGTSGAAETDTDVDPETRTPTATLTATPTPAVTATATGTPTQTLTPTPTPTPSPTPTRTPTPTPRPYGQSDKIAAADGDEDDYFGSAVAVDGETTLVGAYRDEDPHGSSAGSAYVFERTNGAWEQTTKLVASDGDRLDRFGYAVALDGDTALVGAQQEQAPNGWGAGAVYVFERADGWEQTAKLAPADGDDGDWFGSALAVSGDAAVVGAHQDQTNGTNAGAAYVFQRTDGEWTEAATLLPDDGDGGDRFGYAVGVTAGTVVVGAFRDENPNGSSAGSAYVFERADGAWTQAAKLAPDDGGNDHRFGNAVAIAADTLLVGAWQADLPSGSGRVHAYTRADGGWAHEAVLSPPSPARFGVDLALSGTTAVISAGNQRAYVYRRGTGAWPRGSTLTADDGDSYDNFGAAVDIDGDTVVVGARGDEDPNGGGNFNGAGSAYLFEQ
jgi:hypothetical protein